MTASQMSQMTNQSAASKAGTPKARTRSRSNSIRRKADAIRKGLYQHCSIQCVPATPDLNKEFQDKVLGQQAKTIPKMSANKQRTR